MDECDFSGVLVYLEGDLASVERVQRYLEEMDRALRLRGSFYGSISRRGSVRLAWRSGSVPEQVVKRIVKRDYLRVKK